MSEREMMESKIMKLESEVVLKASAKEFHDVLFSKSHQIANVCPEKVQGAQVHEGQWGTEGSIFFWNYVHEGKNCVAKEVIESVDRENYKKTIRVIEGDLLEHYKSFKTIVQVIPQEKGSIVHWIMEYEKLQHHIPDPHSLLQFAVQVCKDIDAHLTHQHASP